MPALPLAAIDSTLLGFLVIGVFVAVAALNYFQRVCPHCGEYKSNDWKRAYPVCKKCGRDRRVGQAAVSQRVQQGQTAKRAAPGSATSPLDQLGELATLRDKGVITSAEFEAKKAELLKRV